MEPPVPPPPDPRSAFVLRPGGIGRSTDLWFVVPPAVGWTVVLIVSVLVHELTRVLPTRDVFETLALAATLSVIWILNVLRTQKLSDTTERDGSPNFDLRHDFWLARMIALSLLSAFVGAAVFLSLVVYALDLNVSISEIALLSDVIVLVVTVAIVGAYTRYTAMAFRTDSLSILTTLETASRLDRESQRSQSESLLSTFAGQTDRIIAEVQAMNRATVSGLDNVAEGLKTVASALEAHAEIAAAARLAAEAGVVAQREAIQQIARAEVARREDASRAANLRRSQIMPNLAAQLRVQGTLLHTIVVDIFNGGFSAMRLNVTVRAASGWSRLYRRPEIASNSPTSFTLGDVAEFPQDTEFEVSVEISDVDGNVYVGATPFHYSRATGFLGFTRSITLEPTGWQRVQLSPARGQPALE
jgi:hypothetical protein